jgi:predicted acetyltransferase
MQAEIVAVTERDIPTVEALLQFYIYDFTDFMDWDVGPDGRYTAEGLDGRLLIPGRHPFLLKVAGALAGFAIVDQPPNPPPAYSVDMKEFFVMRRFRRHGVGTWFATALFERFPGLWRVEQLPENQAAIAFWRKVIGVYTGGHYEETTNAYGENVQYFNNAQRTGVQG